MKDLVFQCFTDPAEWAAATWRATAFTYDPTAASQEPPGIGIAFENFNAGKIIFDGWIRRLGHVDAYEELRVSIIEGPIPSDPHGYTVFISSNPLNTVKRKQKQDPQFDPTTFARISRMNRMNPVPGSPHLRCFKKHFSALGRYRLFPVHFDGSKIKALDLTRYIEKRELNFLNTSDLKPYALEYSALSHAE